MKLEEIRQRMHTLRDALEVCRRLNFSFIGRSYGQFTAIPSATAERGERVFTIGEWQTLTATRAASLADLAAALAHQTTPEAAHEALQEYSQKHRGAGLLILNAAAADALEAAAIQEPGSVYALQKHLEAAAIGAEIERIYANRERERQKRETRKAARA